MSLASIPLSRLKIEAMGQRFEVLVFAKRSLDPINSRQFK